MMKQLATLLILLALTGLLSIEACQQKKETEVAADAAQPAPAVPAYPALGNREISELYASADKVDIIFYNLPISVNQEDASSVRNTVLYISPVAAVMNAGCKPLGRLSWMSKGVIVQEADVYSDSGCNYLIFMKDNKPVAANALELAGIEFFKNIISQVEKNKPQ
jgi:hypothetical protein